MLLAQTLKEDPSCKLWTSWEEKQEHLYSESNYNDIAHQESSLPEKVYIVYVLPGKNQSACLYTVYTLWIIVGSDIIMIFRWGMYI